MEINIIYYLFIKKIKQNHFFLSPKNFIFKSSIITIDITNIKHKQIYQTQKCQ